MKLLAIDTANARCSVAIGNGTEVLAECVIDGGYQHAEQLTVLVQQVLQAASVAITSLSGIVVSAGPGSYTGLRIGASVAKGLAYGASLPLLGVGTLEMMTMGFLAAHEVPKDAVLIPLIDARRDEVFAAAYDAQLKELLSPRPVQLKPNSFDQFPTARRYYFGSGAPKYSADFGGTGQLFLAEGYEHARHLLSIGEKKLNAGEIENLAYFRPDYRKAFYTTHKIKSV